MLHKYYNHFFWWHKWRRHQRNVSYFRAVLLFCWCHNLWCRRSSLRLMAQHVSLIIRVWWASRLQILIDARSAIIKTSDVMSLERRPDETERACNLQKSRAFADRDQDVDHECKSLVCFSCSCLSSSDQSDLAVTVDFVFVFTSGTVLGSGNVKTKWLSYSDAVDYGTIVGLIHKFIKTNKHRVCSHILRGLAAKTIKVYVAKHSTT